MFNLLSIKELGIGRPKEELYRTDINFIIYPYNKFEALNIDTNKKDIRIMINLNINIIIMEIEAYIDNETKFVCEKLDQDRLSILKNKGYGGNEAYNCRIENILVSKNEKEYIESMWRSCIVESDDRNV